MSRPTDHLDIRAAVTPDDADVAWWESLSEEQKRKALVETEEAGFRSGVSEGFSMARVKAAALASMKHEV